MVRCAELAANGLKYNRFHTTARLPEFGGTTSYGHYSVGWAHAMDTPYQWTKQVASHFEGA